MSSVLFKDTGAQGDRATFIPGAESDMGRAETWSFRRLEQTEV